MTGMVSKVLMCVIIITNAVLLHTTEGHSTTTISGQNNVTIDGQTFSDGSGNCLDIINSSNITVTNSTFENCAGEAITVSGTGSTITITGNTFTNVRSGLYVNGFTGNAIVFNSNRCTNMIGPVARGQCVQFNGVSGTGHRIQNNRSISFRNTTDRPEDHINMFNSGGAVGDYIQITGNIIEGGGPATSGCGILAGDFGGSYINIENNFLLNTGGCGIGVAGGSYIVVNNNRVYGRRTDVSNIGISSYASTVACSDITVTNNLVWWYNKSAVVSTYYLPTGGGLECTNRTYTNNRNDDNVFYRSTRDIR